jgi:uncharacterized protein (DUF952 family)
VARLTLHLVPEPTWDGHDPRAAYLPDAYADDGFVHCTDGDEAMVLVANRFYAADPRPFLLLTLDLDRTGSPWRFDDAGERYPHIYGPIDPASVVEIRRMARDSEGRFIGPVAR